MPAGQPSAADAEYSPFAGSFVVTLDGVEVGSFREVSGLSAEVEVHPLAEGGNNRYVHQLPGRLSWPHIVLKRGVVRSDALFQWFLTASEHGLASTEHDPRVSGALTRQTAAITVHDPTGEPVRTWNLQDAFPVRWTGPTLATTASDIAVEELELAHHGFHTTS